MLLGLFNDVFSCIKFYMIILEVIILNLKFVYNRKIIFKDNSWNIELFCN